MRVKRKVGEASSLCALLIRILKLEPQIPPISQILRRDERTNLLVANLQGIDNVNLT
jgi:hypothetical protein